MSGFVGNGLMVDWLLFLGVLLEDWRFLDYDGGLYF